MGMVIKVLYCVIQKNQVDKIQLIEILIFAIIFNLSLENI